MFDILKDELVGLMIRLSGEYRDGIPAVRLSQSNMKIFYNLCKEHELEGVVASHILEDGLCELPEYWKEDYLKEKERIEYFKTKCRLPRYLTKPRQRRSEWDMAGSDGISRVSAVFRGKSLLTNKMRII